MMIGNLVLLVLNLPLVGVFAQLLRVRAPVMASVAVVVTLFGAYSINNLLFDMWAVLVFGVVGYLMRFAGFEPGPLVLAFVLGELLEQSFRQSMLLSQGQLSVFVTEPLSAAILLVAVALLLANAHRALRRRGSARGPEEPESEQHADAEEHV
jgi:putative tricarboxylic transport membrane protein